MKKATIVTFVVLALIGGMCGCLHHYVVTSIGNRVGNAICEQADALAEVATTSAEAVGGVCEAINAGAMLSSIDDK